MPDQPVMMPQPPISTLYYYSLRMGNEKRHGRVDAPSATDALVAISKKLSEKDMRTGRIDLTIFRLH